LQAHVVAIVVHLSDKACESGHRNADESFIRQFAEAVNDVEAKL
jgi:hypothetical protein